jgi:dTDP-4-dehydrorhamnose 3,5-epimerase-like enzyme
MDRQGETLNEIPPLRTVGTRRLRLPSVRDHRGALGWCQIGSPLPFEPRRFWWIFDVPPGEIRGNHAHRAMHELLVCVHGSCRISLDDGVERDEVVLDAPDSGLYIPPLTWSTEHRFSPGAVLLAVSNELYRPDDYIHDYDEFLALAARGR